MHTEFSIWSFIGMFGTFWNLSVKMLFFPLQLILLHQGGKVNAMSLLTVKITLTIISSR